MITKSDAAWLAIRISGLALILNGVQHLAAIIYFGYLLGTGVFSDVQGSISDRISLQASLPQFILGLFTLAAAYYLLFKGDAVHRIVMKEGTKGA